MLNIITLDPQSLVGAQIPHVPDSHSLIAAEVAAYISGQEPVHLPLAGILGTEGTGRYSLELLCLVLLLLRSHNIVMTCRLLLIPYIHLAWLDL